MHDIIPYASRSDVSMSRRDTRNALAFGQSSMGPNTWKSPYPPLVVWGTCVHCVSGELFRCILKMRFKLGLQISILNLQSVHIYIYIYIKIQA